MFAISRCNSVLFYSSVAIFDAPCALCVRADARNARRDAEVMMFISTILGGIARAPLFNDIAPFARARARARCVAQPARATRAARWCARRAALVRVLLDDAYAGKRRAPLLVTAMISPLSSRVYA